MQEDLTTQGFSTLTVSLLISAGMSVLLSLGLQAAKKNDQAVFVGQWPPTLAALAVLTHVSTLKAKR